MTARLMASLGALALGATGLAAAAPAEARTFVSIGIGAPYYPRPYRWGYYAPPPPPYYYGPRYYGPRPVVVGGYWRRPYWYGPRYRRPHWRRW